MNQDERSGVSRVGWVIAAVVALTGAAARAEESPAEIARKSRERGALNLVDLSAQLELVTVSKDGRMKEQAFTSASKRIAGKLHTLSRFSKPAGVAGVAVLTVENGEGAAAAISLYLPKVRRVRKVARSDRGKAFMDTDFSYADLGGTDARDAELERRPDEQVDGRAAFVLVGRGGEDSPYGKVTLYVDRETYVPLKVEYEDKEGRPFKRYRTLELKRSKDRTIAAQSTMENLQTGSKTTLRVLKLEESALDDAAFSERALERG